MDWHVVPRSIIDGSIRAVRAPVDLMVGLTGGRDRVSPVRIAVDRADAATRETLGRMTWDARLVEDGKRRRRAADERQKALGLRTEADQKQEVADRKLDEGRRRAEVRRQQTELSAEARD